MDEVRISYLCNSSGSTWDAMKRRTIDRIFGVSCTGEDYFNQNLKVKNYDIATEQLPVTRISPIQQKGVPPCFRRRDGDSKAVLGGAYVYPK
ncbi:rna-dependent rna polymerase [Aspergillus luchuensis]|uniref:Rna-dependent rna polymerase n=1 Tax=Aspergillus kawachii TaxID=1069201 RepID=A0A146F6X8_ASPKA|nr:rna-dependent rna polymerase [Aspergillus luchuensis]